MNQEQEFQIIVADETHESFAEIICDEMAASAQATGNRYCQNEALNISGKKCGRQSRYRFYHRWHLGRLLLHRNLEPGEYVANSGLIVAPAFRKSGLAKKIKKKNI